RRGRGDADAAQAAAAAHGGGRRGAGARGEGADGAGGAAAADVQRNRLARLTEPAEQFAPRWGGGGEGAAFTVFRVPDQDFGTGGHLDALATVGAVAAGAPADLDTLITVGAVAALTPGDLHP